MKKRNRSFVSLLIALSFVVLAVTGVLAFALPFSLQIVGLHALMGFVFIGIIALHVVNNYHHLSRYMKTRVLWATIVITVGLTGLFLWQPAPIRSFLKLSQNLGPATDRFEVQKEGLIYQYRPSLISYPGLRAMLSRCKHCGPERCKAKEGADTAARRRRLS
mgnify:CR=1 FL=1